MNGPELIEIDPRELRLPTSRPFGADPGKLQRQISRHGRSTLDMPPVELIRGSDGHLVIYNGVTRATRIAKLSPGTKIEAIVIQTIRKPVGHLPTVEEKLP